MKNEILFSVVVPVYNNPEDLRRCLESLRAQNFPRDRFEIIVVDNNSTDDTARVPAEFAVPCLSEKDFQSSYAARNRGIMAARGEFIAFTDSDCIAHPDWLKEISAIADDQTAGCFAGEILSVEPTTLVERFSDNIGLLRQRGPLSGWHFKPYAQTANAIYRKEVFDRIGLFDPNMKSGGDAAIAWRMLDKTGYKIRFVPEAIVYHHHRTSVEGLYSQFRRYGGGKMSWAISQKDYSPPAIAALEKGVIDLLQKHIGHLEANGANDDHVFSALRVVTQVAHLSGYLQDLLRYTTDGEPLEMAPSVARSKAASCDICGSNMFVSGPGGRLAKGRPPQCGDCGSLERHRLFHRLFARQESCASLSCLSVGDVFAKTTSIFRTHRQTTFDQVARGELGGTYDIVVCANVLTSSPSIDLSTMLAGLVRVLHEKSILVLYEPSQHRSDDGAPEFAAEVAQRLPNIDVNATTLTDEATRTIGTIVVARPKRAGSTEAFPVEKILRADAGASVLRSVLA